MSDDRVELSQTEACSDSCHFRTSQAKLAGIKAKKDVGHQWFEMLVFPRIKWKVWLWSNRSAKGGTSKERLRTEVCRKHL